MRMIRWGARLSRSSVLFGATPLRYIDDVGGGDMWICFNDGFVSAVEHRDSPDILMIRARRREILENLFPGEDVVEGGSTDYQYRVVVAKTAFADVVSKRISEISYPNFKDSVEDLELHQLYEKFWSLHRRYQR